MRLFLSSLGALCALQVLGASAQAPGEPAASCIQTCLTGVKDKGIVGCPAADNACLCGNPSFQAGVQQCSADTCKVGVDQISAFLNTGFCAGLPISQPSATTAAPANTEAAATTPAEPSKPAETTVKPQEQPDAGADTATGVKTDAKPTETENPNNAPTTSSAPAASGAPAASSAPTTSSAGGSKPKETSSNDPSKVADSSKETESSQAGGAAGGLSSGAEIGIGVGVAAGVLSIFGVALFLFLRSRKRRQGVDDEIPSNLPRGGRDFGSADSGLTLQKHQYDMEVISNRYEDMVPRQTPRVMV